MTDAATEKSIHDVLFLMLEAMPHRILPNSFIIVFELPTGMNYGANEKADLLEGFKNCGFANAKFEILEGKQVVRFGGVNDLKLLAANGVTFPGSETMVSGPAPASAAREGRS